MGVFADKKLSWGIFFKLNIEGGHTPKERTLDFPEVDYPAGTGRGENRNFYTRGEKSP
jgi:hypothetical protein